MLRTIVILFKGEDLINKVVKNIHKIPLIDEGIEDKDNICHHFAIIGQYIFGRHFLSIVTRCLKIRILHATAKTPIVMCT